MLPETEGVDADPEKAYELARENLAASPLPRKRHGADMAAAGVSGGLEAVDAVDEDMNVVKGEGDV